MKKALILSTIAIAALAAISGTVFATVGGDTVIHALRYEPETGTVYYTQQSFSGKGCPPELMAIPAGETEPQIVIDCDLDPAELGGMEHAQKISQLTENMPYLYPFNLKKNGVTVTVEAGEVNTIGEERYPIGMDFTARIMQGGKVKATVPFTGCSEDQPLVVDAYSIPNGQGSALFLFSRKGNCFEGGYVEEFVKLVPSISVTDDSRVSHFKQPSALAPHEGSIVAYAAERHTVNGQPSKPVENASEVENEQHGIPMIAIVLGVIAIVIVAGFAARAKR